LVAYAAAHDLKVKDLYQWKTALARRGLLPAKSAYRAYNLPFWCFDSG